MVALFAIEAQQGQRATTDIDFLTDARSRPSGTVWATERLQALGATPRELQASEQERGFRVDFDGQIVDVLAPDGLGLSGATTTGKLKTIQIPGGTQALNRIEVIEIVVDEVTVALQRPTLIQTLNRGPCAPGDFRVCSTPGGSRRLPSIGRLSGCTDGE
jgi:hypothetical protein